MNRGCEGDGAEEAPGWGFIAGPWRWEREGKDAARRWNHRAWRPGVPAKRLPRILQPCPGGCVALFSGEL